MVIKTWWHEKNLIVPSLNWAPRAKIKGVFFAGHTVAMVTYIVSQSDSGVLADDYAVFWYIILASDDK